MDKVNVHGKAQKRKLWLFSDLLLYAAPATVPPNTFIYKDSIPAKVCLAGPVVGAPCTLPRTFSNWMMISNRALVSEVPVDLV